MDEQEKLQQQMAEIGARYLRRTLDELVRLRELIASLREAVAGESHGELVKEVQRLAHRINGSGAMFGFDAMSERAQQIELLAELHGGDDDFISRLEACVSALEKQARASASERGIE